MTVFEKLHEEGNTIVLVTHETHIAHRGHRIIQIFDGRVQGDKILTRGLTLKS